MCTGTHGLVESSSAFFEAQHFLGSGTVKGFKLVSPCLHAVCGVLQV